MADSLQSTVERLRGLLEKATPGAGHWFLDDHGFIRGGDGAHVRAVGIAQEDEREVLLAYANRDLLLAAVNALPDLLALVEEDGWTSCIDLANAWAREAGVQEARRCDWREMRDLIDRLWSKVSRCQT